jgi:hypothetical protein
MRSAAALLAFGDFKPPVVREREGEAGVAAIVSLEV